MTDNPFDILEKLQSLTGRVQKQAYLARQPVTSVAVQLLLRGYDRKRLYGLKHMDPVVKETPIPDDQFGRALIVLLDKRSGGELDAAPFRTQLRALAQKGSSLALKWMNAILKHKMRNGITGKTFLQMFPNTLSRFTAKLADTYRFNRSLSGVWYVEPKYDGMRAYAVVTREGVTSFSRTGKAVPGLDCRSDIQNALMDIVRACGGQAFQEGLVFDGELLSGNRQESIGNARASSRPNNDLVYHIWDVFSADDWQARMFKGGAIAPSTAGVQSKSPPTYGQRRTYLDSVVASYLDSQGLSDHCVRVAPQMATLLDPTPNIIDEHMMTAIQSGYEGIILKSRDHVYTGGRNGDWLKCKSMETTEFPLIDVLEGDGRLAGTCGRIVVDVKGVRVRVGTKMSDDDRAYFWQNKEALLSKMTLIEVGYQGYTPDGSLDFPRFLRIRHPE